MVSINNSVGSLGGFNTQQTQVKSKTNTAGNLDKQSKDDFSNVLTNSQQKLALTKNTDVSLNDTTTYSPLMMRYGANKIKEIQNIAQDCGINDLTNQDFDYAIRYGRSIIADYIV
ncbi:MAG: hypothetical protein AB7V50_01625 [Vampirovibrionia bacterium]